MRESPGERPRRTRRAAWVGAVLSVAVWCCPSVPAVACVGDCDADGTVGVAELVRGVDIALALAPVDQCPGFVCNSDGSVTVGCLVRAVGAALNGCVQHIAPVQDCAGLASEVIPDTVIESAQAVAAGAPSVSSFPGAGPVPAHCVVTGEIGARTGVTDPDTGSNHYGTRFELRLPTDWRGGFVYQGGGGADGVVGEADGVVPSQARTTQTPALWRGFAVVVSDAGHQSGLFQAGFGIDPQARLDYAYASIGQVTPVAKSIIAAYYGRRPLHSYFTGCSKGGQEAMQASQRYGDQFDGAIAGDPGFNLARTALTQAWDIQAFAPVARALSPDAVDASGDPLLFNAFSPQALQLVADAVEQACDARDGLTDHIIFDQAGCAGAFKLESLQCPGAPDASCLPPIQIAALQKVFSGAKDSQGAVLYSDWPYDAGIGSAAWSAWKIGFVWDMPVNNAINLILGQTLARYLTVTPPRPDLDLFTIDIDDYARAIHATGIDPATGVEYPISSVDLLSADSTNLDPFVGGGGKLIIYHGASDPVVSVNNTERYYDALTAAYGRRARDFARLFVVPGMTHCSLGDYAVDSFDTLTALTDWVEDGRPPDALVATVGTPSMSRLPENFSRPLCAYPNYAQYEPGGDTTSADGFRCVAPE
jgi:hypothetical protein